jgi:predicted AAA+ superfamily ATPase
MKKDIAVQLIKDFIEKPLPELIDRDLQIKPPATKKAITIIGPRRAGKTYFLFNNMKRLKKVNRSEILYVNLNRKKRVYLYLDEVQNVEGWEKFVRRVLDTENIQVYITGSSSKLLAKEIATTMRGRSVSHLILPFSFDELLKAKGLELERYLSSDKRAWIMKYLDEYVRFMMMRTRR